MGKPDDKGGRGVHTAPVGDEKGAGGRGAGSGSAHGTYPPEGGASERACRGRFAPVLGWRFGVWLVLGFMLFAVDQVTKAFAQATLVAPGVVGVQVLPGILDFELVYNYGAAFGIGQGMGFAAVALAVVVIALTVVYFLRARLLSKLEVVGLGLVMGGALGNALDRLVHGFVVDFIAVQFIDFPVFNVADICIVAGVCLAFLGFAVLSPANARSNRGGAR